MDGRPNRRNIAACLNFSGVVRTETQKITPVETDRNSLCIFLMKD